MNVRVLPVARDDAADAAVGLELLQAGWGDVFEADFRQAVAAIGATHDFTVEPRMDRTNLKTVSITSPASSTESFTRSGRTRL